jgi:hypothetical protein
VALKVEPVDAYLQVTGADTIRAAATTQAAMTHHG